MFATFFTAIAVVFGSAVVGQAVFSLLGRQRISSLAPAVGLAVLLTVAWWTVRLPGRGTTAIILLTLLVAVAAWIVWRRRVWAPDRAIGLWMAAIVATAALLLAMVPFFGELRFGILGTSLNPDMSQHLFAASQLAGGGTERLIDSGYPLGPHALVAAFESLGVGLVQGFGGLTVAIAVIACLTPMTMLRGIGPRRQVVGALLIGLSYLFAAALVQGSFKEMAEALFVLAAAIACWQLGDGRLLGPTANPSLRGIPIAVLAIGIAYTYSFPGLFWIIGGLGIWAAVECTLAFRRKPGGMAAVRRRLSPIMPAVSVATGVVILAILPEASRMSDFGRFETFAPAGAGLGNLFESLSPFLALGVWPSGDFRVEPGDGAVPAFFFIVGAALALWILFNGIRAELREREYALVSMLGAALLLWLYAELLGTPYQAAKALTVMAPLVMLISVTGFIALRPGAGEWWRQLLRVPVAALFIFAAAVSSLLILVNGPVGPSKWTPMLNQVQPLDAPVLLVADRDFLDDRRGRDLAVWELRGTHVCTENGDAYPPGAIIPVPRGVGYVVTVRTTDDRPLPTIGADLVQIASDERYTLWRINDPVPAVTDSCPFVPDGPNRTAPAMPRTAPGEIEAFPDSRMTVQLTRSG